MFSAINSHVDSLTPFRSVILSCQWSLHIIHIQLHVVNKSIKHCYVGYFFGLLAVSTVRFTCGLFHSILLVVSLTLFYLRLAFTCMLE